MCLNLCLLLCASPQSVQGVLGCLLVCIVLGIFFLLNVSAVLKQSVETLVHFEITWTKMITHRIVTSHQADYFGFRFEAGACYSSHHSLLGLV